MARFSLVLDSSEVDGNLIKVELAHPDRIISELQSIYTKETIPKAEFMVFIKSIPLDMEPCVLHKGLA